MAASSFPDELILYILDFVPDIRDVLACTTTCTHLKSLIDGSTAIEYRIELAKAGYQDGPTATDSFPAQRLELLRRQERAWNTFDWVESRVLDLPLTVFGRLERGVFIAAEDRQINCVQLPSALCDTGLSIWTHDDIGFNYLEFATDPERDLLVILECPPNCRSTPANPRVHVRTLSTNMPSPLANEELLQLPEESYICYQAKIHILGTKIGVLFPFGRSLVIWDMVTGNIYITLRWLDCYDFTFSFLTSTSLLRLCVKEPECQPYIDIITFSSEGSRLVASFQLPRITTNRPRYYAHYFDYPEISSPASSVYRDPSEMDTDPRGSSQRRPFYPDANHHIISFHWRMTARSPWDSPRYHLFVPAHVFLDPTQFLPNDYLDGSTAPIIIEWSTWGPQFSRLLCDRACLFVRDGRAIYGNRFVAFLKAGTQSTGWPAHESRNLLAVYDFNRAEIHNTYNTTQLPNNRTPVVTVHDTPETLEDPFFVEGSVTTSLPFRLSVLGYEDFEGDDIFQSTQSDDVRLRNDMQMWFDQEHIIFLKVHQEPIPPWDTSMELVVFTM